MVRLFGKGNKEILIVSPMKGRCVSLESVPDQVFSKGALGQGCAIIPVDGHVYAPIDSKVTMVFPTGHAIGLITKEGVEVFNSYWSGYS